MRTAKTLIRLGGCPGWSESSLGAHTILLVLSRCGSVHFCCSTDVNWWDKMPAVKDPSHPRAFVKPLPLPIESQKGLKLQRRDSTYINPELPTRDEIRRSNYERRKQQMATMGFRSVSHKPYVGIGDPFFLDQKKLILHALGQWDEVTLHFVVSDV